MIDDAQQQHQQQQASSGALLQVSSSPIGSQKKLKWTLEIPAAAFFFGWQ
jgi:hypothetical protein